MNSNPTSRRPAHPFLKPLPVFSERFVSYFLEGLDQTSSPEGCWLWKKSKSNTGYGRAHFNHKILPAHRVAYRIFKNKDPYPYLVCHTCDQRACCSPSHLFLGTLSSNNRDCFDKQRHTRGNMRTNAILAPSDIIEIRRLQVEERWTQKQIALKFGVCRSHIGNICVHRHWKHI